MWARQSSRTSDSGIQTTTEVSMSDWVTSQCGCTSQKDVIYHLGINRGKRGCQRRWLWRQQSFRASPTRLWEVRCFIGWCVVLLMRYLGIVWGQGYPREQVVAVPPPLSSPQNFRGVPGLFLPVPAHLPGVIQLTGQVQLVPARCPREAAQWSSEANKAS